MKGHFLASQSGLADSGKSGKSRRRDSDAATGVSPVIRCSIPEIMLQHIQKQIWDISPEVTALPKPWREQGIVGKPQNLQISELRICSKPVAST